MAVGNENRHKIQLADRLLVDHEIFFKIHECEVGHNLAKAPLDTFADTAHAFVESSLFGGYLGSYGILKNVSIYPVFESEITRSSPLNGDMIYCVSGYAGSP
jgi:hypothetical protein